MNFLRKINEPPSRKDCEFRKKCESQRTDVFNFLRSRYKSKY